MDRHLLDLSETGRKKLSDGKRLSGHNQLTDILISKIQRYYSMAIRNNINDLHSMKTSVWTVYFHLLSSNESPQHGLCPAGWDLIMPPLRNRVKFQQLKEFERSRIIGLRKREFLLSRNSSLSAAELFQNDASMKAMDRRAPDNTKNCE
ncbi:uncharacterized protein TNCV_192551 [Trichonephila clavipes]|nr:uncharacterized protein TNCV_192551 [Trichonephila clavipes]